MTVLAPPRLERRLPQPSRQNSRPPAVPRRKRVSQRSEYRSFDSRAQTPRIFGLETEFGITCALRGQRRLSPDEVARYLFRSVVSWGRSSNVFLANGSRLYLDVGSHPEYATPECDRLDDLIAHDKAGEWVLEGLRRNAEKRLAAEGIKGDIFLYKNNTDTENISSYGCHENFLIGRRANFGKILDVLVPFLVTRQIFSGAGKLLKNRRGTFMTLAQRSEHIWERASSATTRSRPLINTRDEPHADSERFRRLHIIAGDSNMSEYVTYVKVGVIAALLEMIENNVIFRDLSLSNPIRAIRDISHDISCRQRVRLNNGRELSALDIQWEYLERVMRHSRSPGFSPQVTKAVEMWEHLLAGLEKDPLSLHQEVDWVSKYRLIDRYRERNQLRWSDPNLAWLDLSYHDINPSRGLYYKAVEKNMMDRVVNDLAVKEAMKSPPETTRARLRGRFIQAAKAKGRDFTVDWVHLKLNDQKQRTVLLKDPFVYEDERVDRLIAEM